MNLQNNIDPFTLEIVRNSLIATGDEMFHTIERTAMSPIIYEVLDYATGLTDRNGKLITQGNGVTLFIGMLSSMVKRTIDKFGDDLHPGDIIVINDPYVGGGSHLSDVGLVMPLFYQNELIGFAANKAHWVDVGGKDPGSFTNDATEIFQEGIQLPCVKLFEKGKINIGIKEIINHNIRFPELSIGDLWAQVSALRTGENRVKELCDKYGHEVVTRSMDYLLEQGKTSTLKELAKIQKGVYTAEDVIDTDGLGNGPLPIKVKVTVTDDEFICDFRGSHPQVEGPVNCSYTGLVSAVRTVFLGITNPSQDLNDGAFSPLKIITDKASVFSAEKPAPVSLYFESMNPAADLVWKALAPILPERLTAGHLSSMCSLTMWGNHHVTGEPFLIVEPSFGGWGAGKTQDGARGLINIGDGETYNMPVEIAEFEYGVQVEEYSFRADGAGAGKYVGGSGLIRSYKALTDDQRITASFGRHKSLPWGIDGGREGSANEFYIRRSNGDMEGPYGFRARCELNTGDTVILKTATGGGYGNPLERDEHKVLEDILNGYITIEQAKEDYGVIVDPETLTIIGETDVRKQLNSN